MSFLFTAVHSARYLIDEILHLELADSPGELQQRCKLIDPSIDRSRYIMRLGYSPYLPGSESVSAFDAKLGPIYTWNPLPRANENLRIAGAIRDYGP